MIARIFAIASVEVAGLIKTHRGVLQGGVCSPSLFNIYVNSLIPILKATGAEVLLYADDLVLVTKSRLQTHRALVALEQWCTDNSMKINRKKSATLVARVDRRTRMVNKPIQGIPVTDSYKYLGLVINDCFQVKDGVGK